MRNKSLDGLRGVAALIVVLHHHLLTIPWFSNRVNLQGSGKPGHLVEMNLHDAIEYSPLHIFYAGTEAVTLFFVLSGYVLVYAVNKNSIKNYLRFRLYRLYGPVIGTVCLSYFLLQLVHRRVQYGQSSWLQGHIVTPSLSSVIQNFWLVDGNTSLDSSLWSMRCEIIFSMCVMTLAGLNFDKNLRKFILLFGGALLLLFLGDHYNLDLLGYLPIFFAGSALHFLPQSSKFTILRFAAGVLVILVPWYIVGFGYNPSLFQERLFMTLGAMLIVDSCRSEITLVARLLKWRPIQAVGRYSYSLYLIHAPILITVWFALGQPHSWSRFLLNSIVSIFCIVCGTAIIYSFFEKPVLKYIQLNVNGKVDKVLGS